MIIYLAAPHSYPGMIMEVTKGGSGQIFIKEGDLAAMKVYLAGPHGFYPCYIEQEVKKESSQLYQYRPYILESFFYCDADVERLIPEFDFLLDSGAFTFMQGTGGTPDWDDYVSRYADFIKKHKITKYFELDIDSVVGYDKVKKIRSRLESLTGIPSIPVWHLSRGMDEYRGMCKDYDYVAIGGIVNGEIPRNRYKAFPVLIDEAHKQGAKIHGLGFTNISLLPKYHFDSVDSTAWTAGNRFGFIYYFDGHIIRKKKAPAGHRISKARDAALNNYIEWIKFQKYAEKHL